MCVNAHTLCVLLQPALYLNTNYKHRVCTHHAHHQHQQQQNMKQKESCLPLLGVTPADEAPLELAGLETPGRVGREGSVMLTLPNTRCCRLDCSCEARPDTAAESSSSACSSDRLLPRTLD